MSEEQHTAAADRLVSESLAYTAIDAAQNLLALLVVPASFFWLTPADMGTVTLALVGTQIVMTLGGLGFDFGIVRYYLAWPPDERDARVRGIFIIVLAETVLLTAGAVGVARAVSPAVASVVVASVSAGAGLALRAIPLAVFRVTSEIRRYALVVIAGSAIQAGLQLAALAAGLGVVGFLAAGSIALWASAISAGALSLRRGVGRAHWPDGALLRLASWHLAGGVFNRMVASVDRLAILFWSTVDALGVYGTASRWTLPLRTVSGGTKLAIAPALSRAENAAEPNAAVTPVAAFVTMLALLAVVLQLLSSLLLFTPWRSVIHEFQRLLSLLLAAQLLGCLTLIGQVLLYYVGRSARSAGLAGLAAGMTLAGLVWLVPRYGAMGAALAQLGASAMALAAFAWTSEQSQWMSPQVSRALGVFAAVAAAPWVFPPILTTIVALGGTALLSRWAWRDLRGNRRPMKVMSV